MNNNEKYEYWEDIAEYDLATARAMLQSGRYLYVVFMCQQAIEKLVKGLYVLYTGEEPPRTHNIWLVLSALAVYESFQQKANDATFVEKKATYKPFFAELVAYYISERYPSYREKLSTSVKEEKARHVMGKTEEVFRWLQSLRK
ncbi:HEPN domain-containing protein [Brevibacillus sp. H7]|uniref:HEPN domain-containing protein n=1 Tax=Brevibacillus sp. H7 TaxID=3349138 RepID=UPI00381A7C6A